MNTLTGTKTDYLLEAGLNILHDESNEWKEGMELWKDELRFLDKVLRSIKTKDEEKGKTKKFLEDIEKRLSEISGKINDEIISHEKYLAKIMRGEQKADDQIYRERHRTVGDAYRKMEKALRILRSEIYSFVKQSL